MRRAPKIVVVGGTGTIGARVVTRLRAKGMTVVVASRASGVDLVTGEGLPEALTGAEVVIDVSKTRSRDPDRISEFFSRAGENLTTMEHAAGVGHHIMLSIVGTDRAPGVPFYAAKTALERTIRANDVPFTILHTTQFFEFAPGIAQSASDPHTNLVRLPPLLVQPVAGEDVAAALAQLAGMSPAMRDMDSLAPKSLSLMTSCAPR